MEIVWEQPLHERGSQYSFTVSGDIVVSSERLTRLVRLDPRDGSLRWDVPSGAWRGAHVGPVVGQRCLVRCPVTGTSCVDTDSGARVWSSRARQRHVVAGDTILCLGYWRTHYQPGSAIDLQSGRVVWQPKPGQRDPAPTVWPAAVAGGFLLGSPGGARLRWIHPRRQVRLAWDLPRPLITRGDLQAFTVIDQDRCLAWCQDGLVAEIAPESGPIREFRAAADPAGPEQDPGPGFVTSEDGLLWLRHGRPYDGFTVLDARDGSLRFRFTVPGQQFTGDPVAVEGAAGDHQYLLASATAGCLYRIDAGGRLLERFKVGHRIHGLQAQPSGRVVVRTKSSLLGIEPLPEAVTGD